MLVAFLSSSLFRGYHSKGQVLFMAGAIVVCVVYVYIREKLRKFRTRNWPTAPGRVTNLHLDTVEGSGSSSTSWKLTFDYNWSALQEHSGTYSFSCSTQTMADAAMAGLEGKTVTVRYPPSDESRGIVLEDDVWDIWQETYRQMCRSQATSR